MTIKITPFDTGKFLKSEEAIAYYLKAIAEVNDPELFEKALENAARARELISAAEPPHK